MMRYEDVLERFRFFAASQVAPKLKMRVEIAVLANGACEGHRLACHDMEAKHLEMKFWRKEEKR